MLKDSCKTKDRQRQRGGERERGEKGMEGMVGGVTEGWGDSEGSAVMKIGG